MSKLSYEKWLESMGEAYYPVSEEGRKLADLEASFLWKRPLENMLGALHYEHLGLPRFRGLLFSGGGGNGKHTYLNAFIQSVCQAEYCFDRAGMIRFRADDFSEEQLGSGEAAREMIDAAFEMGSKIGSDYFVVFDQMEGYDRLPAVCNYIADAILAAEGTAFHVLCLAEDGRKLSSELKNLLLECRCGNPNPAARKEYLSKNLSQNVEDWTTPGAGNLKTIKICLRDLTLDELTSATEGFSYKDLENLILTLRMDISSRSYEDLPTCDMDMEKDVVLRYAAAMAPGAVEGVSLEHLVGSLNLAGTQAASPAPNAAENRLAELTGKKGQRSFSEDAELIDMVPTLRELTSGGK